MPWRFVRPASGSTSAPPSPYFVKKPVTASAAWSVPTTSAFAWPAMAYCAIIRARALTLPFTKSRQRRAEGVGVLGREALDGAVDVERHRAVGPDELQRQLGVVLVGLHRVRQADGVEGRQHALVAEALHGELAEPPGEARVLAAADAEHEARRAGVPEVRLEEADAPVDLVGRVDVGRDVEVGDDRSLLVAHRRGMLRWKLRVGDAPDVARDVGHAQRLQRADAEREAAPGERAARRADGDGGALRQRAAQDAAAVAEPRGTGRRAVDEHGCA